MDAFHSGAPEPAGLGDAAGTLWGGAAPDEGVSEHETWASKSRLWSYTSDAAPVV